MMVAIRRWVSLLVYVGSDAGAAARSTHYHVFLLHV